MKPAPANDDLSGFVVGNSSEFNQLVQSGNIKVATQLANAVLQSVEQSDTTATKERIEVGDNIIIGSLSNDDGDGNENATKQ